MMKQVPRPEDACVRRGSMTHTCSGSSPNQNARNGWTQGCFKRTKKNFAPFRMRTQHADAAKQSRQCCKEHNRMRWRDRNFSLQLTLAQQLGVCWSCLSCIQQLPENQPPKSGRGCLPEPLFQLGTFRNQASRSSHPGPDPTFLASGDRCQAAAIK